MTTRYPVAMAAMVAAVVAVAGCAASAGDQRATPSAGAGSASAAYSATPPPSPSTASSLACAGPDRVTVRTGQVTVRTGTSPPAICLAVGRQVQLDAPPSPQQPWQPFTSSNPDLLACTSAPTKDGGAAATCHALQPGTATVTTTTAPFAGDPHGPPQYTWQLTVTITA
jgi:hypothetical protein